MKLAIMQPYFLPYIGYFQLIKSVDKFVFYDDVNYINRGWINRNRILVNGRDFMMTVPLIKASQNKLISEVEVSNESKWRGKLIRTIYAAYKKAPQFDNVYPLLEKIIEHKCNNIADYAKFSIKSVCEYVQVDTEFVDTSTIYNNQHLAGQNRILDICKQDKADFYINPIGGLELYDRQLFEVEGINFRFISSIKFDYPQFGNEFIPWLSVLDVLMFNSLEQISGLLDKYEFS